MSQKQHKRYARAIKKNYKSVIKEYFTELKKYSLWQRIKIVVYIIKG